MAELPALLFDVGNSRVKWGVLTGDRLSRTGGVSHEDLQESGFNAITTRIPRDVSDVLASNVAGATFATRLAGVVGIHCKTDVHFARPQRTAFGVTNSYSQPRRMGVDRWAAMIGARGEFETALCVVDAGTAITIDAIDRQGHHLGGQILPGLHLMTKSVSDDTSDIGAASRKWAKPKKGMDMFATRTGAAVQNGALAAVCGAVERAARTMRGAGFRPKIVLTGGDASRILKQLEGTVIHRPNLVLQGLAVMLRSES